MARRIVWTEQARADVRTIEQPIALQIEPPSSGSVRRIIASSSAIADYLEISRVLDRKEAYR